jgi:hypothetical protein
MNKKLKLSHWRGISFFKLVSITLIADAFIIAWMFGLF